jgi:hypothetical protein
MTTTAAATAIVPVVGMGASFGAGSDSYPATVVEVSKSGKRLWITQDSVVVAGEWAEGEDEASLYTTVSNMDGARREYTLRKNGRWILAGCEMKAHYMALTLGVRRYRQDPSF